MNHTAHTKAYLVMYGGLLAALLIVFMIRKAEPVAALDYAMQIATPTPASQGSSVQNGSSMAHTEVTTDTSGIDASIEVNSIDLDNQVLILTAAVRQERLVDCLDSPYHPMMPDTVYSYENETAK
ncbi:MAG: hypothetical protein R3A44_31660 [Caldilineaceae bacterium]